MIVITRMSRTAGIYEVLVLSWLATNRRSRAVGIYGVWVLPWSMCMVVHAVVHNLMGIRGSGGDGMRHHGGGSSGRLLAFPHSYACIRTYNMEITTAMLCT